MSTAKNEACLSDYIKIAIWWWGNDTFDMQRCKFIEGDFSDGEVSKFLVLPEFPTKVRGKGGKVYAWWGKQSNIKRGGIRMKI